MRAWSASACAKRAWVSSHTQGANASAMGLAAKGENGVKAMLRRKYPGEMPDEVDIDALSDAIAGNEFESVDEFAV